MSVINGFTPTQKKLLALLGDGLAHDAKQLLEALDDELAEIGTVYAHVSNIRKKINPAGDDIVCRAGTYRLVRMVQV